LTRKGEDVRCADLPSKTKATQINVEALQFYFKQDRLRVNRSSDGVTGEGRGEKSMSGVHISFSPLQPELKFFQSPVSTNFHSEFSKKIGLRQGGKGVLGISPKDFSRWGDSKSLSVSCAPTAAASPAGTLPKVEIYNGKREGSVGSGFHQSRRA